MVSGKNENGLYFRDFSGGGLFYDFTARDFHQRCERDLRIEDEPGRSVIRHCADSCFISRQEITGNPANHKATAGAAWCIMALIVVLNIFCYTNLYLEPGDCDSGDILI